MEQTDLIEAKLPEEGKKRQDVQTIDSFLKKYLTNYAGVYNKPAEFFQAWVYMKSLEKIVREKGWRIPYAAFNKEKDAAELKRYNLVWRPMRADDFAEFYEAITGLTMHDLVQYAYLGKATTQPKQLLELRPKLCAENSKFEDDLVFGKAILFALAVSINLKQDSHPEEEYKERLKRENLPFAEPSIPLIFRYTVMWPFSDSLRKLNGNAKAAYSILKKVGSSNITMLWLYGEAWYISRRRKNPLWDIRDKNEWEKIRFGYEEEVNSAIRLMKRKDFRPSDMIGAVMEHRDGEDSQIELGYVQPKFLQSLREDSKILIINPSAFFVQNWPEECLEKTTFVVLSEEEALLYQLEFSKSVVFVTEDQVGDINDFTRILYFPRPNKNEAEEKLIKRIATIDAVRNENGTLFMALLDMQDLRIETLKTNYPYTVEFLLPRQAVNTVPKRRMLLYAVGGKNVPVSHKQQRIRFVADDLILEYKDSIQKSTNKEVFLLDKKIQESETKVKNNQNEGSRKGKSLQFSEEMIIWYTDRKTDCGGYRIEVSAYEVATDKQKKRNQTERGKLHKGGDASHSCDTEEEAKRWALQEYPYRKKIHKALKEVYIGKIEAKTLKTAWYLYYLQVDKLHDGKHERETLLYRMMDYFGAISTTETNSVVFQEAMKAFVDAYHMTDSAEFTERCWNSLEHLYEELRKRGICTENPISRLQERARRNHKAEDKIREALMKKSFTADEMRKIYEFLNEQLQSGNWEYLGVMLRLLTGLKANILCGLTWGDIHKIPVGENAYQIWIAQSATNNGSACEPLMTATEYRRFPVTRMVYDLLMKRKGVLQQCADTLGLKLNAAYLLSSESDLQSRKNERDKNEKALCPIPSPNKLRAESKKVLNQMNMESVELDIPVAFDDAQDDQIKTINLTSYRGDIFNMNYRFHLKYDCGISQPEENHLMGLTQYETYSKHYLDFNNDLLQLMLLGKMNRMEAILNGPASIKPSPIVKDIDEIKAVAELGYHASGELRFCAEKIMELALQVRSEYGAKIQYNLTGDAE